MGARALGVGALFVNVLLVLARDGSRSNPHPTPPPAPARAPAPPLLGQPSEGGERRHPAAGAATAVRVSGERGYLLASMYLFFLKGGSGATPLAPRLECHPARPARMLDERGERFRTLALSRDRVRRALPVRFAWNSEPWKPRKGLRGRGESLVRVRRGSMIKKLAGQRGRPGRYPVLACPWGPVPLGTQTDSPLESICFAT